MSNYWSDKFNALPDETRHIACAVSVQDNINYLKREKIRLIKRHKQSLKEINDHIKRHEQWLKHNYPEGEK